MKEPPFKLPPFDSLGPFGLGPKPPATWTPDPATDFDPEPMGEEERIGAETIMRVALAIVTQKDKERVFLDMMKNPHNSRIRREALRDLARATGRSDKEIQALPDPEKARLFARRSHRINERLACMVVAGAMTGDYFGVINQLLDAATKEPDRTAEIFERYKEAVPATLWDLALYLSGNEPDLPPARKAAVQRLLACIPHKERALPIPFAVGEAPRLTPLEQHLFELHQQDPQKARQLLAGLAQLAPNRAENWLLFALADCPEPPPHTPMERAWHLAGQLYLWADDAQTADKAFDPQRLAQNRDAIRLLFSSPDLAPARRMIDEYLIAQLAEARDYELLLEVLPQSMYRAYPNLLDPVVSVSARKLADEKPVEVVRPLLERFPFLKNMLLLPLCLRRNGQFEAALAELRNAGEAGSEERALAEAKIANAFELELPESPEQQQQLVQRLDRIDPELTEEGDSEICYAWALRSLLTQDRSDATQTFDDLGSAVVPETKRKAYQLLSALQAQAPELIDSTLAGIDAAKTEEMLAFIPSNLLRAAVRALGLASNPAAIRQLATVLYGLLPEVLDPLLENTEMLGTAPILVQRLLDKTDKCDDVIQRWAGYQRVLDLPSTFLEPELAARAIDSALAIEEPLFEPHQVRLLCQRIPQCQDADLRELLAVKLSSIRAEEAKPFLYQLLHSFMGQQKHADAWRMVETLRDLGETGEDLTQCAAALEAFCRPAPTAPAPANRLSRPVSVGFYGGDTSQKSRTDQLRAELMRAHPGLTVEFDHTVWNPNNLAGQIHSVAKYDVIVASNLMRTLVSRRIRQRARELGKTWGYCRNQGLATITQSILSAVDLHLARKS